MGKSDDNPKTLAKNFCKKYKLGKDNEETLIEMVREKMQAIKEYQTFY